MLMLESNCRGWELRPQCAGELVPCYLKELGHVVCGDWLIPGARVLPEYSVESDDSYQGVDSMGGVRLPQLNAFTSKAAWTCLEQVVKRSSSAACNLEVLFSMRASRKMKVAPCCTFVAHQYLNWQSNQRGELPPRRGAVSH